MDQFSERPPVLARNALKQKENGRCRERVRAIREAERMTLHELAELNELDFG